MTNINIWTKMQIFIFRQFLRRWRWISNQSGKLFKGMYVILSYVSEDNISSDQWNLCNVFSLCVIYLASKLLRKWSSIPLDIVWWKWERALDYKRQTLIYIHSEIWLFVTRGILKLLPEIERIKRYFLK